VTLGSVLISVYMALSQLLAADTVHVGGRLQLSHILPVPSRRFRPVPHYTAWWQRQMCVNKLPRVVTWWWNGWWLNLWLWHYLLLQNQSALSYIICCSLHCWAPEIEQDCHLMIITMTVKSTCTHLRSMG